MNLEETIKWTESYCEKHKQEGIPEAAIKADAKMLSWLKELYRYRLFYSEVLNEFELSSDPVIAKERIVKFLEDEHMEWDLKYIIE